MKKVVICFFIILLISTILSKYVSFRGNPIPSWDELLAEMPLIIIFSLVSTAILIIKDYIQKK